VALARQSSSSSELEGSEGMVLFLDGEVWDRVVGICCFGIDVERNVRVGTWNSMLRLVAFCLE